MLKRKSLQWLLLFFLFPLLLPYAQQGADGKESEIATACIFDAVDLSKERDDNTEIQQIITEALKIALEHARFEVIAPESTRAVWDSVMERLELGEEDRLLGKYVVAAARRIGADVAITGFFRVEGTKILLTIKGYGVQPERFIASRAKSGRVGITLHNMINDTVSEILPLLKEAADASEDGAAETPDEVPMQEVLLLSNDENAEIFWAGQESAGYITDGSLLLSTIRDTQLILEYRKEGYHPRTQVFDLGAGEGRTRRRRDDEAQETPVERGTEVLELKPLAKEAVWGTEFSYTLGQALGLGFGIRYYLKPGQLFVSGEDYFFLQKALGTESSPVFHNDFRFLLGRYVLFPPTSWFRIGISTGLGFVLSRFTLPGMPLYTDLYINFLNWWFELNTRNWIFTIRQEGRFMLGIFNHLLKTGWHSELPWGIPITFGVVKKWQTQ